MAVAFLGDLGGAAPVVIDFAGQGWPATRASIARASNAWHFNSAGVLTQASTDQPRLDHDPGTLAALGLLREGPSTNYVANPRCEGAVAGTPGTAPTGWTMWTSGIHTIAVDGAGTEDGIPYVDFRIGSTNGYGQWGYGGVGIRFHVTTAAPTTVNDKWAGSVFVRLMNGSLYGNTPSLNIQESDAGGGWYGNNLTSFTPTTAALRGQRYSGRRTAPVGGVGHLQFHLEFGSGGTNIGCVLRVGLPQLEKLDFVTSPIMPPASSPAQATRAGELILLSLADFASVPGITLAAEYRMLTRIAGNMGELFAIGATGSGHSIGIRDDGTNARAAVQTGVLTQTGTAAGVAAGTVVKAAVRATASEVRASYNGTLLTAGTPDARVAVNQATLMLPFAQRANAASLVGFGHIRKVGIYPTALADAALQVAP